MVKGNMFELFNLVKDYWSPKVVAEVNDDYVKIAKFKGDLIWHSHEHEDEMFFVLKGKFELHLENEKVILNEGDFYVVKKGVLHKPLADEECCVMLIENKDTKHTGNIIVAQTKSLEDQLK